MAASSDDIGRRHTVGRTSTVRNGSFSVAGTSDFMSCASADFVEASLAIITTRYSDC